MNRFTPPYRVGRKTKRAVLDSNGLEVVVFREGMEDWAAQYAALLNKPFYDYISEYWSINRIRDFYGLVPINDAMIDSTKLNP